MHDHENIEWFIVDNILRKEHKIIDSVKNEVICYGLNVHTKHGQLVGKQVKPEKLPHFSFIIADDNRNVVILGSVEGAENFIEKFLKELDYAKKEVTKRKEERKKKEEESKEWNVRIKEWVFIQFLWFFNFTYLYELIKLLSYSLLLNSFV